MRILRPLLVATLAAALVAGAGLVEAPRPVVAGVAPRCTTGDTLTRYRTTADWYRSVLDTRYRLAASYAPRDLVSVSNAGVSGGGRIRRIALRDFTAMARAARIASAPFAVESAYRSYATQVATFWGWVSRAGFDRASLASARGGHSEHQLGTAVDLKTPGRAAPWRYADWGTTRAGAWLGRNSWRYGWILSYPKGKSPGQTCYKYEPWHFRYVGRTIAAQIHASGLAPREWLWRKGAMGTWTGGSPFPTPQPTPSPSPSGSPEPSPSASPSAEPTSEPTPSADPTSEPSPSASPSAEPSPSASPSAEPRSEPTPEPTSEPTPEPAPA